jgi:multimeric flavodoxin WrbA
MKILAICGSPRKESISRLMLKMFLELPELKHGGHQPEITIIDAYKENIKPCTHCAYCKKNRFCKYDDFKKIDAGFQEADILIFASPVYCMGFPAPLKAIFDRTQQYFEAKFSLGIKHPVEKHKKALFLCAYGSSDSRSVQFMEAQIELVFNVLNAELCAVITASNTDKTPFNAEQTRASLEEALKKMLAF